MDVILWSEHIPTSAAQVQKSYDWTIAQWSGIAAAALTAILGLLSATIVEMLKGTLVVGRGRLFVAVGAGVSSLLAVCGLCQYEITQLNNDFLTLYAVLALLR